MTARADEEKSILELVNAPISALSGVSEQDAADLKKAFNIITVKDLAQNKYVRFAQAIGKLSDCSGHIFDKMYEIGQFVELAEKPMHAISGIL